MSEDAKQTTDRRAGTVGIVLALWIYGNDAVVNIGDWLTPGIIRIPVDDIDAFANLEREELSRVR